MRCDGAEFVPADPSLPLRYTTALVCCNCGERVIYGDLLELAKDAVYYSKASTIVRQKRQAQQKSRPSARRAFDARARRYARREGVAMTAEFVELKAMWLELRARVDQLAGERRQYLDIFEQSPEAYVVTDAEGTIVDANGAAMDVLQRRRGQLKGKSLAAMVALERRHEFRARTRAVDGAVRRGLRRAVEHDIRGAGLRADVTVRARAIERAGAVAGLCWLLQAAP